LSCVSKQNCSDTPMEHEHHNHTMMDHSSMMTTYDDKNPRDRQRCAMGLLMEAAKPSMPTFTATQKAVLKVCLQACRPPEHEEDEEHSSMSSSQSSHHHRRMHHNCLMKFCTKDNFKACFVKDPATESAMESFEQSEFADTCSCLQKSNADATCTMDSTTCSAAFANEAKMWAEHHSSSSS